MADRQPIHAVHSEDQQELLERLGLLGAFTSGDLKCRDCDRPVAKYGLGLVQMNAEGEIEVACADTACRRGQGREAAD
jgi:hypothetical protein